MNKEFIPYTEALALKELGFDEDCFAIWSGIDEQNFSVTDTIRLYSSGFRINGTQSSKFYVNDFNSLRVAAPTFSQAFRWVRTNYGYWSYIKEATKGTCRFYIEKFDEKFFNSDIIDSYEEAELECLKKLIKIVKQK